MKIMILGFAFLLSQAAQATPADFVGSWSGTCTQTTEPHASSHMEISFTANPKLTLNVWGLSLVSGEAQRIDGNNPATFLFREEKGNALSMSVKFYQDRFPEIRWHVRKVGAGLKIQTLKYAHGGVVQGTRWQCDLSQ